MRLFVSIAAYRDPELAPTLRDCIARARYPHDLRFGICWQHTAEELPPAEFGDPHVRVIDVPWNESRGACWARAEIMRLWDGEELFLQLDSHHRFVQDWDAILLAQADACGAAKPVLSSYGMPFDPQTAELPSGEPMQMDFDHFTGDGIPLFRPRAIPDWPALQRPVPARFISGHFLFAPGSFVTDVAYDPELYFHGEEITLAIRAFTHGYALFHPSRHVLWHEYTRDYRVKHWDDHVQTQGIAQEWHMRDAASREKVRHFLAAPPVGPFGCGAQRTLADYEAYAGISFAHRAVQDATLRGLPPPNPAAAADWAIEMRTWQVRIVLPRNTLPPAALSDPQFWYVGLHDADGTELHRQDAHGEELRRLLGADNEQIVIERCFTCARQPATWTVWPATQTADWLDKIVGMVDRDALIGG